jgi:hypothetical protein
VREGRSSASACSGCGSLEVKMFESHGCAHVKPLDRDHVVWNEAGQIRVKTKETKWLQAWKVPMAVVNQVVAAGADIYVVGLPTLPAAPCCEPIRRARYLNVGPCRMCGQTWSRIMGPADRDGRRHSSIASAGRARTDEKARSYRTQSKCERWNGALAVIWHRLSPMSQPRPEPPRRLAGMVCPSTIRWLVGDWGLHCCGRLRRTRLCPRIARCGARATSLSLPTGQKVAEVALPCGVVRCVDDQLFLSADRAIRVLDAKTLRPLSSATSSETPIDASAVSPDAFTFTNGEGDRFALFCACERAEAGTRRNVQRSASALPSRSENTGRWISSNTSCSQLLPAVPDGMSMRCTSFS